MLELKYILANPDEVKGNLKKRNDPEKLKLVDELIHLSAVDRKLKHDVEQLRHQRNNVTDEIRQGKKAGHDVAHLMEKAKNIPHQLIKLEQEWEGTQKSIHDVLYSIPNLLHESVPIGASDADNVVVREVGHKPNFDFEPKGHTDILEALGIVDLESAAKVSGARFYFLKGQLVMLEYALLKFTLDFMHKKDFILIEPPSMLRREFYEGVTDMKDFEDVMYKIEGEDLYLIATSEHPMASMLAGKVLQKTQFPVKYAGISPCFRKEAGAHGKDTKGIFRVHQFQKVEQFVFALPEQSWEIHEQLLQNAEEIMQSLGIPYRVVNVCTGDIGSIAAKKFDIEAWMPAQNTYREMVSCSNCTSYQATRLNIKYQDGEEKKFVHTLNSTAIATPRLLVAIIENFQQKDGSIKVPNVLLPYMNGVEVITKV